MLHLRRARTNDAPVSACRLIFDFDLIFGTAKQNLKIIETPIHYKARTFGETPISRFRDGWLLLKMVWFAYRKLKAV